MDLEKMFELNKKVNFLKSVYEFLYYDIIGEFLYVLLKNYLYFRDCVLYFRLNMDVDDEYNNDYGKTVYQKQFWNFLNGTYYELRDYDDDSGYLTWND
jgi:hypothetical protein